MDKELFFRRLTDLKMNQSTVASIANISPATVTPALRQDERGGLKTIF